MHCLYGLQQMGLSFELKGGTSLSKGYNLISRFSEDIDIRIEPPQEMDVKTGPNHDKNTHCEGRKAYYDWLTGVIEINGIESSTRDTAFDDAKYRSGGIRLHYESRFTQLSGLKEGILLEVGFDVVIPKNPKDISSWAYDYAAEKVDIIDNRAIGVKCYHPGYTLVEKLQTISTKYRKQQESGEFPKNFLRHYYDVYCLLQSAEVRDFIGTDDYQIHKEKRFPLADNPVITENAAFLLQEPEIRKRYTKEYQDTYALYYKSQPGFDDLLSTIQQHLEWL